ncbi:phosphoglycerate dehydrogenase [Aquibacillus koreensis]|uniref:D-3-phosphoglycerate dehydrogenase n=1 Tax=Aquibacillus koreensis TaxID=279446 RepID=A0A9X3WPK0_9BACI|nr:phosphoglycerate dehydrogenase [Aquibacillus koreensis]MCT2537874.1 phosphoglycerate dehydrogenase [Aquibacillus koreensis]MDC3421094.1 phosphoglycerate dehydrogenase [Aquibacillus koreensis]
MKFKVLISDPLSEEGILPLKEAENVEVVVATDLSPDELAKTIKDFDALLVRSQTKVTREIIRNASKLKIIGRAGVGVDNIDLDAATEHGVIVVNAPDGNTNSAAEHTMAMLMSLARKIPQAYFALKNQKWDRKSHVGVELKGKTLGVIGLGRIGAEVAARAQGQRMNIIAYDPFLTAEKAEKMGVDYGTVEDVVKKADFITVHTPLLKETKHLINKDTFKLMKDGVQIVNCARGGIIDEDALYEAIVTKKVAGAALDVFEEEPAVNHKLLELHEVIATPHLGASTVEAQENVAIDVSKDVLNFLTTGLARNPVNLPSVPKEIMRRIEPYFHLSEKLGIFLTNLTEGVIEEINIYYSGELAEVEVAPLTRNTIKGILKKHLGEHVNDVNASYMAEKKGITVNEQKTNTSKGFTNLLKVEVKTKEGTKSVAGTLLNGLGARIVQVDTYSVDLVPEGHLVFIRHKDQPGAIGRVGSTLADQQINIATMQVGRSNVGGEAIMLLTIDKHLDEQELEQLDQLADIYGVTAINL